MRLDKYISDTSPLSRSEAKKAIKAQRVLVNGQVATSANLKIEPDDKVQLDSVELRKLPLRYLVLNKPEGYVCATQDSDHPTVLSLLQEPLAHNLHIAGRLDKDTTGLVLLTDDGQWSHRVTSPKHECRKRYRVELSAPITRDAIVQLEQGILLNDETKQTKPASVEVISDQAIYLTISEGRYHQVKRMLAAVGNHVCSLHRDRVGTISLDEDLSLGDYRALNDSEIHSF